MCIPMDITVKFAVYPGRKMAICICIARNIHPLHLFIAWDYYRVSHTPVVYDRMEGIHTYHWLLHGAVKCVSPEDSRYLGYLPKNQGRIVRGINTHNISMIIFIIHVKWTCIIFVLHSQYLLTPEYDKKFQFLVFAIFRTDKKESNI